MQLIVYPPGPVRCCLLKQDQVCGNRVCGNQVVPEVDDKYIAYQSKGKAQHSYIRASSYRDVWVSSKAGTVTSYYICLANTRWDPGEKQPRKCRRLTESKRWDKRKDDTQEEWVSKQRWYCQCRARYHGKWGQVAIIEEPDGRVHMSGQSVPHGTWRTSVP